MMADYRGGQGLPMGKEFNIIYADPPWAYADTADTGKRGACHKYPTMTHEEIMGLPVHRLGAMDSCLFMWATFPKLPEALEVMAAWGYCYKTVAFTWVKREPNTRRWFMGMGHWTRANAEIVLLGTRGSPSRVSAGVSQVIDCPRGGHSEKPHKVRGLIIRLCGDLPRIELFARNRAEGWDAWGNELDGKIITASQPAQYNLFTRGG